MESSPPLQPLQPNRPKIEAKSGSIQKIGSCFIYLSKHVWSVKTNSDFSYNSNLARLFGCPRHIYIYIYIFIYVYIHERVSEPRHWQGLHSTTVNRAYSAYATADSSFTAYDWRNVHVYMSAVRWENCPSTRTRCWHHTRLEHAKGVCPSTYDQWKRILISRIIPEFSIVASMNTCVCLFTRIGKCRTNLARLFGCPRHVYIYI